MPLIPQKGGLWARRLVTWARRISTTAFQRASIIAMLARGHSPTEVIHILHCSRSHVYRTVDRWKAFGRDGLLDGRHENGERVVTDAFRSKVDELLKQTPRDFGYRRPTWTRE